MWYLLLIIVLSISTIVGLSEWKTGNTNSSKNTLEKTTIRAWNYISNAFKPMYSRKQIEQQLEVLAKTPIPKNLEMGAMCYEPGMRPDTATYICPNCSSRTLYRSEMFFEKSADGIFVIKPNETYWWDAQSYISWEILACKRELNKIEGINIELDESEFCKKCNPGIVKPRLYLYVNIEGEPDTTKIINPSANDIRIIGEFLKGAVKYKTSDDWEHSLTDNINRINELFGFKKQK